MLLYKLISWIIRGLNGGKPPKTEAEVDELLAKLAARNLEDLDWQNSVVDLMKLLGLDSHIKARLALARELNYPGDTTSGSPAMNIWLTKEIRKRVATDEVDSLR